MTHSANFYYAILIATAVGASIFMVVVTLTQDQIFGSKLMVEVPPTYPVNQSTSGQGPIILSFYYFSDKQ
ncbi:MAG: hypothetical protein ACRD8W_06385 [Nitrososphaeraceae archaeon]